MATHNAVKRYVRQYKGGFIQGQWEDKNQKKLILWERFRGEQGPPVILQKGNLRWKKRGAGGDRKGRGHEDLKWGVVTQPTKDNIPIGKMSLDEKLIQSKNRIAASGKWGLEEKEQGRTA